MARHMVALFRFNLFYTRHDFRIAAGTEVRFKARMYALSGAFAVNHCWFPALHMEFVPSGSDRASTPASLVGKGVDVF